MPVGLDVLGASMEGHRTAIVQPTAKEAFYCLLKKWVQETAPLLESARGKLREMEDNNWIPPPVEETLVHTVSIGWLFDFCFY